MGSDEQAIKEWYAKKTTALKEGDPDSWIDLFPEDVVFMMPNEETIKGKEALRHWGQHNEPQYRQRREIPIHQGHLNRRESLHRRDPEGAKRKF